MMKSSSPRKSTVFLFCMLIMSLCLSSAFATADIAIGERSFFPENGHTYAIYDLGVPSWEDVNAYCESLGGHLATIASEEENIFLMNLIASEGVKNAYFGLTDEENEGDWQWVTGEEYVYRNWHSGEPNSENSKEDYAMFYWKWSDGTWNDGDLGNRTVGGGTTFICEWDYDARAESVASQDHGQDSSSDNQGVALSEAIDWCRTHAQYKSQLEYNDSSNLNQCVDFISFYADYINCENFNKIGSARNLAYSEVREGWVRVQGTDNLRPGDVFIDVGGEYGHTGVIVEVDGDTVSVVDQNGMAYENNYEGGGYVSQYNYKKSSIWGVLRPIAFQEK